MTLKEIYDGIEEVSPSICKDMEGTCDECPFGVWFDAIGGYDCGFNILKTQIQDYEEQYITEEKDSLKRRNFLMML